MRESVNCTVLFLCFSKSSRRAGRRTLRSADTSRLLVPPVKLSTVGSRAFPVAGPQVWNALPEEITSSSSQMIFRRRLKAWLFRISLSNLRLLYLLFCFILLTLRERCYLDILMMMMVMMMMMMMMPYVYRCFLEY